MFFAIKRYLLYSCESLWRYVGRNDLVFRGTHVKEPLLNLLTESVDSGYIYSLNISQTVAVWLSDYSLNLRAVSKYVFTFYLVHHLCEFTVNCMLYLSV